MTSDSAKNYDSFMKHNLTRKVGKWNLVSHITEYYEKTRPLNEISILELGCGSGQVLQEIRNNLQEINTTTKALFFGVYTDTELLTIAKENNPDINFIESDFLEPLPFAEQSFDCIYFCNALHEALVLPTQNISGAIDLRKAKETLFTLITNVSRYLKPNGLLVIYDGVDLPGDPDKKIIISFTSNAASEMFDYFSNTYKALQETPIRNQDNTVSMTQAYFVRFITTFQFLPLLEDSWVTFIESLSPAAIEWIKNYNKSNAVEGWDRQRMESYQYANQDDFSLCFESAGLQILKNSFIDDIMSENYAKLVTIETPDVSFPHNHILISGEKKTL